MWRSQQLRQFEQLANAVAFWSMLLIQEVPQASVGKVGGAFGRLGGVNLGVSQISQPFTVGRHPACKKKKNRNKEMKKKHTEGSYAHKILSEPLPRL